MNYWELLLYNGDKIRVKPDNVSKVNEKLGDRDEKIVTPTRTILVKNIQDFYETDVTYSETVLLGAGDMEKVHQAFNEPLVDNGIVLCKFVKKTVPRRKWETYYGPIGYHKLSEDEARVTIAWKQPIHQIYEGLLECTEDEARKLS